MNLLRYFLFVLACGTLLLSGCAGPQPEKVRIVWPVPPSEPKLEFLGSYFSEDSFEKTARQKTVEGFLGREAKASFQGPSGIAADDEGRVYIADVYAQNVRVYDFNAKTVTFLLAETFLRAPYDLAVDSNKDLYLADAGLRKVVVLSPDGRLLRAYGVDSLMEKPVYLALNERLRRLYVSDSGRHEIFVFDLDSKAQLFAFGGVGSEDGQLYAPQGLAIDDEDNLYVADMLNARIQVFDQDGNFKRKFGKRGDTDTTMDKPKDLAFGGDGHLWLVDSQRPYFTTYATDGTVLLTTGSYQSNAQAFSMAYPMSIYVTPKGAIYTSDFLKKSFQRWQYLTPEYLKKNPLTQ